MISVVVTHGGTSTNNTAVSGTVIISTSISGGTLRHLKAAFP